jgi:hypothetical protein
MTISDTYGGTPVQGSGSNHPDLTYNFDSTQQDQIVNAIRPDLKASHIFYIHALALGG